VSDKPTKDEKQFDPSAKRLNKAVEEGNVLRSKEVQTVGMLVFTGTSVLWGAPVMFEKLKEVSSRIFIEAAFTRVDTSMMPSLVASLVLELATLLAPVFAISIAAAIGLSAFVSGGFHISPKALEPKLERLSPLSGFKRIFSVKGLFELFKALVKLAIIGPITVYTIWRRVPDILQLPRMSTAEVFAQSGGWVLDLLFALIIALALLALADYAFERWKYKTDLKMTRQEVKDETKEQEGDPYMKSKRKAKARELSRRKKSMLTAVLESDVIVTNPTHYAIGLRYVQGEGTAPKVTVKGIRKRALKIKDLAAAQGIPMVEDRPLARALYDTVPEDYEIPEALYAAVATLLAEIYRLRDRKAA